MNKCSYSDRLQFADQIRMDEKYALVSHYIQIGDKPESQKYKGILKQEGIDVESLPCADEFNKSYNISLSY